MKSNASRDALLTSLEQELPCHRTMRLTVSPLKCRYTHKHTERVWFLPPVVFIRKQSEWEGMRASFDWNDSCRHKRNHIFISMTHLFEAFVLRCVQRTTWCLFVLVFSISLSSSSSCERAPAIPSLSYIGVAHAVGSLWFYIHFSWHRSDAALFQFTPFFKCVDFSTMKSLLPLIKHSPRARSVVECWNSCTTQYRKQQHHHQPTKVNVKYIEATRKVWKKLETRRCLAHKRAFFSVLFLHRFHRAVKTKIMMMIIITADDVPLLLLQLDVCTCSSPTE